MSTRAWIDTLCPECRAVLVKLFGGRLVRVPHGTLPMPQQQAAIRRAIRKALDAGATYREVSALFSCSQATVAAAGKRHD